MLYSIEKKEYNWYLHNTTETEDKYKTVSNLIKDFKGEMEETKSAENEVEKNSNKEYAIKKNEEVSVDTVDGNKISISKFDTIFVKTDLKIEKAEYNEDLTDKELKDVVVEGINEYKTESQIITEEIKQKVEDKKLDTTQKQQEMKKAEEEVKKKEEERKKAEAMKITQANVISKVGEHLKYFSGCYLGSDYGINKLYTTVDVTGKVNVPGVDQSYMMTYEIKGLSSKKALQSTFEKYMTTDVISKLKKGTWGDITSYLHDYNGKVYMARGGIGDGPSMNYKKAKVLSSEGDTTKIQLDDINVLGNILEARVTLTIKYNEETSSYKITDFTVKNMY